MRFHEYLMVFRTVMFFVVFIIHGIINCEGIIFSAKWRKPSTSHLVAKRFAMTEEECSAGQFEIHPNTIIRTGESQAIGGKYLQGIELRTPQDCQRLCCQTENCDVYIFETKNNGYCYLFACGPLDNFHCKFTHHANYTSAVLKPGGFPVSHGNKQPSTSTRPPPPAPPLTHTPTSPLSRQEWELLNLKGTPLEESHQHSAASSTNIEPNSFDTEPLGNPSTKHALNNRATIGLNEPRSSQTVHNSSSSTHCGRFQFPCHSGECIAVYNACDGIPQCEDGSDEGPECSEAENRNLEVIDEQDKTNRVQKSKGQMKWKETQTNNYKNSQSKEKGRVNQNLPDSGFPKTTQELSSDGFATYVHNWMRSTLAPRTRESVVFQYNSVNKNNRLEQETSYHHSNVAESAQRPYLPEQKVDQHPLFSHKTTVLHPDTNLVNKMPSEYAEHRKTDETDEYEVYVDESTVHTTTSTKEPKKDHNAADRRESAFQKNSGPQHGKELTIAPPKQTWESHSDVPPFVHEQYRLIQNHLALEMRDHDGYADRPNGAFLSLLLGLLITAILALMVTCRLRSWKQRPSQRRMMSTKEHEVEDCEETEVIVNGMYL